MSVTTRGLVVLLCGLLVFGCGYRYYSGDLQPADESAQPRGTSVADDGTVTYVDQRLEVGLRPMTDEELNRQFAANSSAGARSTNPYTFGTSEYWALQETPKRFTVFRLKVKNYTYPKVQIDPQGIYVASKNGREYASLSFQQMGTYFRTYAIGYRGNEYHEYDERLDILRQTMFPSDPIFSGQEQEGYIVFENFHPDVRDIKVRVENMILRFDFRDEPAEMTDIEYFFSRDIGRIYTDGRIAIEEG